MHAELRAYIVTALKRCCLGSDRLLSAVVDGMQLKLQQQMEKLYREAFQSYFTCPPAFVQQRIYMERY